MAGRKVMVAMSGGVDSSAAAVLLIERGYEVVGATMRVFDYSGCSPSGSCCSPDDLYDARRVADKLGIPHYTFNVESRFEEEVIKPFAREYLNGRTPNPCVLCNDRMKFLWMLEQASDMDCEFLATGHYARIERGPDGWKLRKAVDRKKDQTYFLHTMTQEQLSRVLFPVGDMEKAEVRTVAERLGLRTAQKSESQEICFIPDGDYAKAVESYAAADFIGSGQLVDTKGNPIGTHDGYHRFTVGQRKGFGSFGQEPRYVVRIEAETKQVVIGLNEEVFSDALRCEKFHWISGGRPEEPLHGVACVRHGHSGTPATIVPDDHGATIKFEKPVRAVTPGQAAVFYLDDIVLGGGFIDQSIRSENDK